MRTLHSIITLEKNWTAWKNEGCYRLERESLGVGVGVRGKRMAVKYIKETYTLRCSVFLFIFSCHL